MKVRPQSGHGGRKGRQGGPRGPKKVLKTRRGAPRGRLFGTLGSKCAPSQNISIYYVLATFPRPGGSCSAPRAPKVAPMEHCLQKWTQKWCQRCPGGRQGSARGGHLDPKGAKRCPKRSPKMTTNGTTWQPDAQRMSRDVPGSLLGYPPQGKTSKKGEKQQTQGTKTYVRTAAQRARHSRA